MKIQIRLDGKPAGEFDTFEEAQAHAETLREGGFTGRIQFFLV